MTDQFDTVAVVYSYSELMTLVAALEARGIMVHQVGSQTLKTLPNWAVALGGAVLRMRRSDLEQAVALLREIAAKPAVIRRPLVSSRWIGGIIAILVAMLTGIPPPARIPATLLAEERRA